MKAKIDTYAFFILAVGMWQLTTTDGTPPTLDALEEFNFDQQGGGTDVSDNTDGDDDDDDDDDIYGDGESHDSASSPEMNLGEGKALLLPYCHTRQLMEKSIVFVAVFRVVV